MLAVHQLIAVRQVVEGDHRSVSVLIRRLTFVQRVSVEHLLPKLVTGRADRNRARQDTLGSGRRRPNSLCHALRTVFIRIIVTLRSVLSVILYFVVLIPSTGQREIENVEFHTIRTHTGVDGLLRSRRYVLCSHNFAVIRCPRVPALRDRHRNLLRVGNFVCSVVNLRVRQRRHLQRTLVDNQVPFALFICQPVRVVVSVARLNTHVHRVHTRLFRSGRRWRGLGTSDLRSFVAHAEVTGLKDKVFRFRCVRLTALVLRAGVPTYGYALRRGVVHRHGGVVHPPLVGVSFVLNRAEDGNFFVIRVFRIKFKVPHFKVLLQNLEINTGRLHVGVGGADACGLL
ncbi:hypothetical protein R80B4_02057 [Fibrobacteres bacterium R8-0-B4]